MLNGNDLDLLFAEFPPQQWLTPVGLPWEQWNSVLTNHVPVTTPPAAI